MAVRCSGESDCPPPAGAELEAFQALERAVVSGQLFQECPAAPSVRLAEPTSEGRRAWFVMLASLAAWLGGRHGDGVQMSVEGVRAAPSRATSSAGRVTHRLRLSRDTSPCTWCHLFGVHGGRIRARGKAGNIHWEFGPVSSPCLVVHGRERLAA